MDAASISAMFKASNSSNDVVISSLLRAVSTIIPSAMCSLWKINNKEGTVSIYARENYNPGVTRPQEYVHDIENSLIGWMIDRVKSEGAKYVLEDVTDPAISSKHMCKKRVEELNLKNIVCIPIPNYDSNSASSSLDAVLNYYPLDDNIPDEATVELIRDTFSMALSRSRLLLREQLTREVISIYEEKIHKDLASVLHPIITKIFRKCLKYEGCSIFLWDPFLNHLALVQTTGIAIPRNEVRPPRKTDVTYLLGEGITGTAAEHQEPILIRDLNNLSDELLANRHDVEREPWKELTSNPGTSFMAIPITRPSNPKDLLGIIRFTNKLNPLCHVIDYFSEEDLDNIRHACNLIALYMEQDRSDQEMASFAKRMSHEIGAPAFSIRGSAKTLLHRWLSKDFPPPKVNDYLSSIKDHADLQMAVTRSVTYGLRGSTERRSNKYRIEKVDVDEAIESANKLAIPFARRANISFNKIRIGRCFQKIYIDRHALEQVFINLLTNAIKYRELESNEAFLVRIYSEGLSNHIVPATLVEKESIQGPNLALKAFGLLIQVEDFGIGIEISDLDKVFLLGYRNKNLVETEVRGSGIGLTIARNVMKDFGGYIWISNARKPTRFSLFFPGKLRSGAYVNEPDWDKE